MNRPPPSTGAVIDVPATATDDGIAPWTAPLIVADPAAVPVVDGEVGLPLPPQAAKVEAASRSPTSRRMNPPAAENRKVDAYSPQSQSGG
jgi:hypothetical protein